MRILLDTSVIVRLAEPHVWLHRETRDCIAQLARRGFEPCIVPQVLYEFWTVATRPTAQNGLELPPQQASRT